MMSVTPTLDASLRLAFGAVFVLLLISCTNVANLLLARLSDRQRELSVRSALGCGRLRLLRQLLTEGLLLAAMGTALGVVVAWGGVRWFRHLNPFELPTQAGDVGLDLTVLLIAVSLSIGTSLLFTLLPAFTGSAIDLRQGLRPGGRGIFGLPGRRRVGQALIAMEIALSFVLLTMAGLLMSSVFQLEGEQLGFDVSGVATAYAQLPPGKYVSAQSRDAFERTLRERIAALPGVTGVAFGYLPPNVDGGQARVQVRGRGVEKVFDVDVRAGSPEYLDLLRVQVARGRRFDASDRTGPAVAIVSRRFADEYFRERDPIGSTFRVIEGDVPGEWRTVVGLIGTWKHMVGDTAWRETPVVFTMGGKRADAGPQYGVWVGARTSGPVVGLPAEMQRQIAALDPNAVLQEAEVVSERLAKMMVYPRFRATLLLIFGAGALLLAAAGVYGVVAQAVAERIPEFGLRRAIGAQESDLALLVLRQCATFALGGLVLGVLAAAGGGTLIRGLLYGPAPVDPWVFGVSALVLAVSAALAMAIPTLRAAKVDPLVALRQE